MAVYEDREAFIPYRKADVIELCLQDGKLNDGEKQEFRELTEILSAFYHFECHEQLERLKDNYAPFNPDSDTKTLVELTPEQLKGKEVALTGALEEVLQKANYTKLSDEALAKAMDEESLITLQMDVDFDDFETMVFYHRGSREETVKVKKLFKEVDFTMDIYERVVLLIKFKDEEYFKQQGRKINKLNFTPGKMYVYMYKNIPQADIELLFPNVEISMNLKDKLMLGIPAAGGAVAMLIKILPSLLIIAGIIFAVLGIKSTLFPAVSATDKNTIIVALTGLAIMGGFIFKQFVKYKNKRIAFLKDVSDTLFFKNLDSNAGVFNALIDAAEEEECKEVYLAYYHLLTHQGDLDQEQLDDLIETWMETQFDTKIDFDVEKALEKLENMKGKIVDGQDEDLVPETPLLTRAAGGTLAVANLDDAKTIVDYVWDNFFDYNS